MTFEKEATLSEEIINKECEETKKKAEEKKKAEQEEAEAKKKAEQKERYIKCFKTYMNLPSYNVSKLLEILAGEDIDCEDTGDDYYNYRNYEYWKGHELEYFFECAFLIGDAPVAKNGIQEDGLDSLVRPKALLQWCLDSNAPLAEDVKELVVEFLTNTSKDGKSLVEKSIELQEQFTTEERNYLEKNSEKIKEYKLSDMTIIQLMRLQAIIKGKALDINFLKMPGRPKQFIDFINQYDPQIFIGINTTPAQRTSNKNTKNYPSLPRTVSNYLRISGYKFRSTGGNPTFDWSEILIKLQETSAN